MEFDDLFPNRDIVAEKLKLCIADYGFSKSAFAARAGISRPTLDKLLAASVTGKTTFDRHMNKILPVFKLSAEQFLLYGGRETEESGELSREGSKSPQEDRILSKNAKKQYNILLNVLNLCAEYY